MATKDELLETLKSIGFSEKEAKVYLTALELKEALPGSIARLSGVKRSSTYILLGHLAKKGLLSPIKKNGYLFYQAKNPQNFIRQEIQKSEKIKSTLEDLHISFAQSQTNSEEFENYVEVSVFKGKENLLKMRENIENFTGDTHCYDHMDNQITIYDGKVAIISGKDEMGVLIKNENIAHAQKTLLDEARKNQ